MYLSLFFLFFLPTPPCVCAEFRHSSRHTSLLVCRTRLVVCLLQPVASSIFVNSHMSICIFHCRAHMRIQSRFLSAERDTTRLLNLLKMLVILCDTVRFLCHILQRLVVPRTVTYFPEYLRQAEHYKYHQLNIFERNS